MEARRTAPLEDVEESAPLEDVWELAPSEDVAGKFGPGSAN